MKQRIVLRLSIWLTVLGGLMVTPTPALSVPSVDPCAGGTLAYWPMTEGSGNTIHDVCNGFDGTFSQGVAWATDAEGPYLQFTASDGQRITINQPALSQNTAITVELRMMRGQGDRVISQMGPVNGGQLRFTLDRGGSHLNVWGATGDGGFNFCPNYPCLPSDQWTHVAFQIDGTQVKLYYDGVLVNSGTLPFPQTLRATNASTEIGTGEQIFGFGGKIQYVRISSGIRNDFLISRNQPPTADAGGPYVGGEAQPILLDASGSSDDNITLYEWDLDNDGEFDDATGITTTTIFADDGLFTIGLRVTDAFGETDTDTAEITVNNLNPTITSVGNSGPVSEGTSATISVTAADPAGASDPLSYEFDCDNDNLYEIGPQSGNTTSCPFADNGSFQVNVRVEDGDGGVDNSSTTVTVVNEKPTVDAGPDATIVEGETFVSSGSFTDPASADTWTATVNYDDGAGDEPLPLTGMTFDLSHLYSDPGVYTVTVKVTDDDLGEGSDAAIVTVQTTQEVVEDIIDEVQDLVDDGSLNGPQGNGLLAQLQRIIDKLDRGQTNAALNQLQAFIDHVQDLMTDGTLTPEEGQPLIDAASHLIDILTS